MDWLLGPLLIFVGPRVVQVASYFALARALKDPLIPADLKARVALERKIAAELGAEYFFDKAEPDAPRLQVPELAKAFGSDGGGPDAPRSG
jgi:hypothetical protein